MLIPDSIVLSFAVLSAEQIREIVNAVRTYQGGEDVAMDSLDSTVQAVWAMALPEMMADRQRKQDISDKRKKAGSQSHKNRNNESSNYKQVLANDTKCYQMIPNDTNCKQMLPIATEEEDDNITSNISIQEDKVQEQDIFSPSNQEKITTTSKSCQKVSPPKKSDEERFIDNIKETELIPPFKEWLSYKREKGQTYKKMGMTKCFNNLRSLSGCDPVLAQKIVDFSISNNYTGLFAPKDTGTGTPHAKPVRHESTAEELNDPWNIFVNPYNEDEQ